MDITKDMILRSWKDDSYRQGLPEDVRKAIPARPTGNDGQELSDADLEKAAGGTTPLAGIGVAEAVGLGTAAGGAFLGGVHEALDD